MHKAAWGGPLSRRSFESWCCFIDIVHPSSCSRQDHVACNKMWLECEELSSKDDHRPQTQHSSTAFWWIPPDRHVWSQKLHAVRVKFWISSVFPLGQQESVHQDNQANVKGSNISSHSTLEKKGHEVSVHNTTSFSSTSNWATRAASICTISNPFKNWSSSLLYSFKFWLICTAVSSPDLAEIFWEENWASSDQKQSIIGMKMMHQQMIPK